MKPIVVELPGLHLIAETNDHEHWRKRQKRAQTHNVTAWAAVTKAIGRKRVEYPLSVTIVRIAPRRLDQGDNEQSSGKFVRDGIARALGINDNDPRVVWRVVQEQRAKTYGVRIEIEHGQRCPTCGGEVER